jgi:hypothetical protein
MYGLGETTQDLRDLGVPHPIEQRHGLPDSDTENSIQRWGIRCRWGGAALLTTDTVATLALLAYGHYSAGGNPITRQVIGLAILIAGLVGTAMLTAGLIEQQWRPTRSFIRRAMARADANADLGNANREAIEKATGSIDQNGRLIAETVNTLADVQAELASIRLELVKMQEKLAAVPDFADGVSRGSYVTAVALGLEKTDDR